MDITNVTTNMQFLGEVYDLDVIAMLIPTLMFMLLWELVWKGFALWRAARLSMTPWFITMLVVNSVGILPIIFLLSTRKKYRAFSQTEEKREVAFISKQIQEHSAEES